MAHSISRREALYSIAAIGGLSLLPRIHGQEVQGGGRQRVLDYLRRHARDDGGYAFSNQKRSHLTPTFAVIASYRLLGVEVPQRDRVVGFVRGNHPRELKKLEQERRAFEFQQVQALQWLGDDAADFRDRIAAIVEPQKYYRQYERDGNPIFQSEVGLIQCHRLLGLPREKIQSAFGDYLRARRRANGSYNNTPANDGSDGHVMNTYWGLQAADWLGGVGELVSSTAQWVKTCQRPEGGFTYQPTPAFAGIEDVAYTRAALRSLQILGQVPERRESCIRWLLSLANEDGGFADRPGWQSNPLATYYALDALDALGELKRIESMLKPASYPKKKIPDDLKVYSIQLEAHGTGSPREAVALAQALKIDLWGAKNAKPGWIDHARAYSKKGGHPVEFFVANEEYGTWVKIPGMGTYSHTADMMAPLGRDFGASVSGPEALTWPDFRERRLTPLRKADGQLVWQFGENEELVRLLLDDSVERGGFAAISTFHFGNPDFTNTEPFLHRWRGQIPFVSLQDAHGQEPWWFSDMTEGFRTLFLARAPTWEGWMEALRNDWVVAVRHDDVSRGETWIHGGSDEVIAKVRTLESEWRWWNNPNVHRPLASLVDLRPGDPFEAGCPDHGVAVRLRCAWRNTPQGFPREALAEFVSMEVDGKEVSPRLIETQRPKGGGIADSYYLQPLDSGARKVTAQVREVSSGRIVTFSCLL
ncbi:MAG TPA: prenyltransferase/squalene oxidase repeat-containing protein [Opitutaceae bacterium]|nr:prenyltransferase/squalene oxidase repeat-containing protein [Opitutaceae bacterium]